MSKCDDCLFRHERDDGAFICLDAEACKEARDAATAPLRAQLAEAQAAERTRREAAKAEEERRHQEAITAERARQAEAAQAEADAIAAYEAAIAPLQDEIAAPFQYEPPDDLEECDFWQAWREQPEVRVARLEAELAELQESEEQRIARMVDARVAAALAARVPPTSGGGGG